jgi:hypothetical protein
MEKKSTRKPFVVPRLQEQATLVGVTLISGGSPSQILMRRRAGGSDLAARQVSGNRTA